MNSYFAIINPAAGSGRCGRLAGPAIDRLRSQGVPVESVKTEKAGDGIRLSREAYHAGFRRFIAVGGDGTSYEIVNGVFPRNGEESSVTLGFLPLGTGNSFLRDFTTKGLPDATQAILEGRSRRCDVLRLVHREGTLHYINLISVGFTAEAGELTNRRFKRYGELGYLAAIALTWGRLQYPVFPLSVDGDRIDARPCIYLTFSNSRFTGGKLMIAPQADTADGLVELTRVGTLGRWDFVRTFPKIFTGAHMKHPLISRAPARCIEFRLAEPIDVMIDGEVISCHPQSIDVLPGALNVVV